MTCLKYPKNLYYFIIFNILIVGIILYFVIVQYDSKIHIYVIVLTIPSQVTHIYNIFTYKNVTLTSLCIFLYDWLKKERVVISRACD